MVPKVGLEPTWPCGHLLLRQARLPVSPLRHCWSVRPDSNGRPPGPKPGALPAALRTDRRYLPGPREPLSRALTSSPRTLMRADQRAVTATRQTENRGLLRPANPQVTGSCVPPYRCGSVYRRAGAAPRGYGGDGRARTCDHAPNQVRTLAPKRRAPHRGRALPTELRLQLDTGRGGGHRTHDLRIKSPLLLPAELHPGCCWVWRWCRFDPAGTRSESVGTESTCAAATHRIPCPCYSSPFTCHLFRSATDFRVVWLGNQQFSRLLHPFRSRALIRMEPASVRMCLRSAPRQSTELLDDVRDGLRPLRLAACLPA